jgi:membrane protein
MPNARRGRSIELREGEKCRTRTPESVGFMSKAIAQVATGTFALLKAAFSQWQRDNATLLAAGLSYFAAFSIVPLILSVVALASLFLEQQAAEGTVSRHLARFVGDRVASGIEGLLVSARNSDPGTATVLSVAVLVFAASRVFGQLQTALNMIWGLSPRRARAFRGRVWRLIRKRLLTFAMVIGGGLLLIAFFLVDASLGIARRLLGDLIPLLDHVYLWKTANLIASFLLLTVGLAAIYKFLPDTRISWKDVWIGAAVTAMLLGIGRYIIGLYFTYTDPGSVFGAAGSAIIVLVGIYLSAQIFLFGAEFTWVYAYTRGSRAQRTLPEREPASSAGIDRP